MCVNFYWFSKKVLGQDQARPPDLITTLGYAPAHSFTLLSSAHTQQANRCSTPTCVKESTDTDVTAKGLSTTHNCVIICNTDNQGLVRPPESAKILCQAQRQAL